jgi:hypothetical protein
MLNNRIRVGDRVRVQFWMGVNDVKGDVEYIPAQPGDSWVITDQFGVTHYVQMFSVMTKVEESDDIPDIPLF